jgi:hypothetical protein
MIKVLLLVFDSVAAWERIALAQRKWVGILSGYLLPLLLLVSAVEGYGLMQWGKARGGLAHPRPFSFSEMLVFEIGQLVLSLLVVFVGAWLIKSLGETFHGRHNFNQAFTVAAYGLSPVILLRMLNAFPNVSPWVSWLIGIALTFSILYYGLPRVMKPDPSHAFGLYLTSSLLLLMLTGLARVLIVFYLQGKLVRLEELVARIVS